MGFSNIVRGTVLSWAILNQLHEVVAYDPTQYLGGNSPWFQGPNVSNLPYPEPPAGCKVDTAAFVSRHGSRYPDPSAYEQWTALAEKIHSAQFTATGDLAFLETWEPVLLHPALEISQVSIGGYKELYNMGVEYRWRYPLFYTDNAKFTVWANEYAAAPRVIDSAKLFTRGYMGPNASFGDVYVLNSTDPRSVANSLAPSDLCTTYDDDSGGANATIWADIYLPPITKRINSMLRGNLTFNDTDTVLFPYLCGFETQITGSQSPWCNVFTQSELEQYEYAQDIRYYYGSGPGSGKNDTMMLPVLNAIVQRLQDGPNATYTYANSSSFTPPALAAMFTNDGQINQLASQIGVFDDQEPLPPTYIPANQLYIASHYVSMRGTITFERLSCTSPSSSSSQPSYYVRIALNDVAYPVPSCDSGPARTCPLEQYAALVARKQKAAGSFAATCDISGVAAGSDTAATFLEDTGLPWEYVVKP